MTVVADKANKRWCPFKDDVCRGQLCMGWVWLDEYYGGCGLMLSRFTRFIKLPEEDPLECAVEKEEMEPEGEQ